MLKPDICPACQHDTDLAALVCSNPECRRALAYCSSCRAATTYTLVVRAAGVLGRDRLRCDRCLRAGVRCLRWSAGGYCNGLAGPSHLLCARCTGGIARVGRSFADNALSGTVGQLAERVIGRLR